MIKSSPIFASNLFLLEPVAAAIPPNSLNQDAETVTSDEDPRIPLRLDLAILPARLYGSMFESEVDSRGQEAGSEDQTADLHFEGHFVSWVGVHYQPPDISNEFSQAAD
jgi:hypothetical protein